MAAVTVSRSQGRLVAVKGVPAEQAAEIDHEAELLKRLDHPGLVRFVGVVDDPEGGRSLHTEFVSSETWATRPLNDPAERAAGMAALAAAVAYLHQMGVAHLHLGPSHVLHGENDRPVLCGLTQAGEATPENRHADLAALADLCHDPALGRGSLAARLAELADTARAGGLSASELARRLDLLGAKRQSRSEPVRAVGGGLHSLRRRVQPGRLIAAGGVVAAVVVAFALGARSRGPEPSPTVLERAFGEPPNAAAEAASGQSDPGAAGTLAAPAGGIDGSQNPTTRPGSSPVAPDETTPPGAVPPVTEPVESVAVQEAAAVLEHGGRRYAVGTSGDFVETGDWNCDGQPTAAIVRASTGGVVLFDTWPGPGETISGPVRWSVDSPTGAEAVAHGQCDLLRVYTTAGSQLFNPAQAP